MTLTKFALAVLLLIFCTGCILAHLTTERPSEKIIEAEFDLAAAQPAKVLIYVVQPAWIRAYSDLRRYLTKSIELTLYDKVALVENSVITYDQLSEFRAKSQGQPKLSPFETASALDANFVLIVEILDHDLRSISDTSYHKGSLVVRSMLFDSAGEKIWPIDEPAKTVTVGFDIETGDIERATSRLTRATAHCIVRYFYDCKANRFRVYEEVRDIQAESYDW